MFTEKLPQLRLGYCTNDIPGGIAGFLRELFEVCDGYNLAFTFTTTRTNPYGDAGVISYLVHDPAQPVVVRNGIITPLESGREVSGRILAEIRDRMQIRGFEIFEIDHART